MLGNINRTAFFQLSVYVDKLFPTPKITTRLSKFSFSKENCEYTLNTIPKEMYPILSGLAFLAIAILNQQL